MEKELRYEAPPKPAITDVWEVKPDVTDFSEGEKACALMKHLDLKVGDSLREHGDGSYFTVNPRMKLRGHSPEQYKVEVAHFKALCTTSMITAMTAAIRRKTKGDKFYDKFCKRLDKRVEYFKAQIAELEKVPLKRGDEEENEAAHDAVKYFSQDPISANVAGLHNCVYWLTNKDEHRNSGVNEFALAWFNKPIPNSQEWREESDGEYCVLTDSEADDACDDYIDEDSWIEAVKAKQTEQSFDDWKEMVKDSDGRGPSIAMYDGSEEDEEVDGTTYFIYRTN